MAEVTVNTGGLDDAAARFARAMDRTLRKWAFEVERRAKIKSPVDTGFNANSIYVVGPDGKMYSSGQRVGSRPGDPAAPSTKGRARYKPGQFATQEPFGGVGISLGDYTAGMFAASTYGGRQHGGVAKPSPDGLSAEVRVGAEYAIYLEMGTVRMKARPFLGPAAEEVTPMLDAELRKNLRAEGL